MHGFYQHSPHSNAFQVEECATYSGKPQIVPWVTYSPEAKPLILWECISVWAPTTTATQIPFNISLHAAHWQSVWKVAFPNLDSWRLLSFGKKTLSFSLNLIIWGLNSTEKEEKISFYNDSDHISRAVFNGCFQVPHVITLSLQHVLSPWCKTSNIFSTSGKEQEFASFHVYIY